jgi:ABC-2 type transport system ATP-binding protein
MRRWAFDMMNANQESGVIVVDGLRKRYGSMIAVDGVSFQVRQSEIFGIVGPNGAGKTTTLEMIEGLRKPDSGTIRVLGHDVNTSPRAVKERIGVQLQASAYFDYLTLTEILDLFGMFYKTKAAPQALLERFGLGERGGTTVRKLSGGQQQRFTIAAALVNNPEIVFLDEPTTGLDPQARRSLWGFIRDIQSDGRTVVLTTHYMEEAEFLCDRVAIMDGGKIVAMDTPSALISRLPSPYEIVASVEGMNGHAGLSELHGVNSIETGEGGEVRLQSSDASSTLPALIQWADRNRLKVSRLNVVPANLEDVFLSLTGHALRE